MFREAMKEQGNHLPKSKEHNCNNVTVMDDDDKVKTGNSRAYSITRVQKECDEETVKQVMAGAGGGRNVDRDCPRDRSLRLRDRPQNSGILER